MVKAPFTTQGVSNHNVEIGKGSADVPGSYASYAPTLVPSSQSSHQFDFSSLLTSSVMPNWAVFENLALTVQPGFYEAAAPGGADVLHPSQPNPFSGANTFQVCVINQGGEYPTNLAERDQTCHHTARNRDCRGPSGVPNDNGATLVVFTGAGTVCLSRSGSDAGDEQFGPTVLAPFARVVIDGGSPDVGYVDGAIIAKSVSSPGNNGQGVQLHGDPFVAQMTCLEPQQPAPPPSPPPSPPPPSPPPCIQFQDLVFVIERSALVASQSTSMLRFMRLTLDGLTLDTSFSTQVGIVAFSNDATTILPLTADLAAAEAAIDGLPAAAGGSSISDGLARGLGVINGAGSRLGSADLTRTVLLISGGVQDVDGGDSAAIAQAAQLKNSSQNIDVLAMGFGASLFPGGANATLSTIVTQTSNGPLVYYASEVEPLEQAQNQASNCTVPDGYAPVSG